MFGHCYRLKLAVTVTRNGNDRFSMFGLDFLRITAIPGVASVVSCLRILFITQMGIHFAFKHLFQYLRMQLLQEPDHIGFRFKLALKFLAQNFIGHCLILYSHFLWHFTKL